jgi:hypothetical protein
MPGQLRRAWYLLDGAAGAAGSDLPGDDTGTIAVRYVVQYAA